MTIVQETNQKYEYSIDIVHPLKMYDSTLKEFGFNPAGDKVQVVRFSPSKEIMFSLIDEEIVFLEGKDYHREDGPAIINKHRYTFMQYSRFHNEHGPALVSLAGDTVNILFYENAVLHNENGPAAIMDNGDVMEWSVNGIDFAPSFIWDLLSKENKTAIAKNLLITDNPVLFFKGLTKCQINFI